MKFLVIILSFLLYVPSLAELNHLLIIFYNFFRGHFHVGINPPFDCFAKAPGKQLQFELQVPSRSNTKSLMF